MVGRLAGNAKNEGAHRSLRVSGHPARAEGDYGLTDITKIDGMSICDSTAEYTTNHIRGRHRRQRIIQQGELGLQRPDRGNGGDRGDKDEPPKKEEKKRENRIVDII